MKIRKIARDDFPLRVELINNFNPESCKIHPRSGLEARDKYLYETLSPWMNAGQLAAAIEKVYQLDPAARDILKTRLKNNIAESQTDPPDDVTPGSAIVIGNDATILVASGTVNLTQWVFQILGSPAPLVRGPSYSTHFAWQHGANALMSRLLLTGDDLQKPILLAGHSLGGACCCVLAAMLKALNPKRDVRLLTMGCPKPGNFRMVAAIANMPCLHVSNPQDVVTAIPPNTLVRPFIDPINIFPWVDWQAYEHPVPRVWPSLNGLWDPVNADRFYLQAVASLVTLAMGGGVVVSAEPHFIATYKLFLGG